MISWKRLFWGRGRIGRRTYWGVLVALLAAGWLSHPLSVVIVRTTPDLLVYATALMLMVDFGVAWMTVCLIAQRLHDVGRSAWWQTGLIALALAGSALAEPAWAAALGLDVSVGQAAFVVAGVLYLLALLALGVVRGDAGPNRYGPSPA